MKPFIVISFTTYTNDRGKPHSDYIQEYMSLYNLKVNQCFAIVDTEDKTDFTNELFFISSKLELHKVNNPTQGASNSIMWKLLCGRYLLTVKRGVRK